VAKVNLPLPERRLRLLLKGKEDWLEEGLLVPAKKIREEGVVWTSLGPLPRWVPGPTTRWAPGTTRLALHDT
jgi:hypothetical protein